MLYSLVVMIGDGKGSFWCGTDGKYMASDPTLRARAGPGEEEEEEKSSATRFELRSVVQRVPSVSTRPRRALWWQSHSRCARHSRRRLSCRVLPVLPAASFLSSEGEKTTDGI